MWPTTARWCSSPALIHRSATSHGSTRQGRVDTLAVPPANYVGFDVSPDGRSLLTKSISSGGTTEIRVVDLARGTSSVLDVGSGDISQPGWSADGRSALISVAPQGTRLGARASRADRWSFLDRYDHAGRPRSVRRLARRTGDGPPGLDDAFAESVSQRRTGSEALREHEQRSVRGAHDAP